MIYTSAVYANADHTEVTGTAASGQSETVKADHSVYREPQV